MTTFEIIPRERFYLWSSLFAQSGGRYLVNPLESACTVRVSYIFTCPKQYTHFQEEYRRLTTPIVETERSGWKSTKIKLKKWWNS